MTCWREVETDHGEFKMREILRRRVGDGLYKGRGAATK